MSVLLLHFITAWNDHFPETNPTNQHLSQTYTSRQTPSGISIYVSNCLFLSITASSDGGALYCTSSSYLLVESSSFFSCKTSGSFGTIYFSNSGGQCVLYEVCCYDCCTTNGNYYQFGYIQVNNAASSKNYLNYSSIVRCVNEYSNVHYMLVFCYGKVCCPSINMSQNKCDYHTVIASWPNSNSNSIASSLTYSSFTDNTAPGYYCISLDTRGSKFEIKSCNILRITQGSLDSYGTIFTSGNLEIKDSCILENKANRIFHQSSSYTTTLSNCTVDKTTNNQNLIMQSTVSKSFILALNHMSTQNCHSEYDSAGYLTPNIQTPSSSKKQIRYCTCGKNFNQHPQTNIVSLISVFILNFINPDAFSCH
jgi:hypothetical protein